MLPVFLFAQNKNNQKQHLIIGTYTKTQSNGLFVYLFDTKTGKLTFESKTEGVKNPSYLAISKNGDYVYAVGEGEKSSAYAFNFDNRKGELTLINTQETVGKGPCYISISLDERFVVTANYGGGVDNEQSSPTFYNCIFKENTAIDAGDGIYNYSGTITLVNTTMVNNGAYGFRNGSGADLIIIKNSIIWDNIDGGYTATNSLIKGTNPAGAGNINATNLTVNEVFADASNLDYALNQNSIALNKGDNASFLGLGSTTLDLAGNARVYKYNNSGVIDLGAYEYQGDPAVLPVTLVDFIAKIEGNGVILQWQTANETNNKGFIVYRKGDVGEFVSLSEINADNSSTVGYQRYQFADPKPLNGNNYYKLVQVDKDGEPTDLGTRALSFSLSTLSIQLYPNPTTSKVFLNEEVEGSFVLFNNIGQKIANGTLAQLRSGWDISSLQKGIYYFSINGNSYKILKQ